MANEIVKDTTPKDAGFVNRGYNHSKREAALAKEEAEIAALEAEIRGEAPKVEKEAEKAPVEKVEKKETEVVETEVEDEKLSREEQTFKKRYGDLRKHMAKKEQEWKAKAAPADAVRMPTSDEDLEAWATKYPEVASIVETIATKKANEKFSQAESRFQEMDDMNTEAERTKAETAIRKSHDDFDELRESDEFHDWVETQPNVVKSALYDNSDDAASVIRVLDLYKVDKGLTPAARKESAKDAAKTVSTRSRTTPVDNEAGQKMMESTVSKMTDKQFEDNYDKINEAMQSGNFVYDVTGKAR